MPGANYNAPVYGVKFVLTRGAYRATFNDPSDIDNLGSLTGADGLDSPEVREQGENLQEFDGGIHADRFYYGRRPVTLSGVIHGHATVSARNDKLQKLMDVTNAMRDDMTLTWQPAGGMEVSIKLRRQQPLRVEGLGPNKTFTAGMVAADHRIYSTAQVTQALSPSGSIVTNLGSTEAFPTYVVTGRTIADARLSVNGKYVAGFTNGLLPDYVYYLDSLKRTAQKGARLGFRRNVFPNPNFEKPAANQYVAIHGTCANVNPYQTQPTPGSGWGTHVAALSITAAGLGGIELQNPDGSGYWTYPYLGKLTLGFSLLTPSAAQAPIWKFVHYNNANTIVATDTVTGGTNSSTSAWSRFVLNHTNAAVGSTKVKVYVGVISSVVGAQFAYVDGIDMEYGVTDGAFNVPTVATNWVWEGAADDSSSILILPGTPTVTGALVGAYDELDLTHTDWVGFPPGNSFVAITNLGIGASATMLYNHAWI